MNQPSPHPHVPRRNFIIGVLVNHTHSKSSPWKAVMPRLSFSLVCVYMVRFSCQQWKTRLGTSPGAAAAAKKIKLYVRSIRNSLFSLTTSSAFLWVRVLRMCGRCTCLCVGNGCCCYCWWSWWCWASKGNAWRRNPSFPRVSTRSSTDGNEPFAQDDGVIGKSSSKDPTGFCQQRWRWCPASCFWSLEKRRAKRESPLAALGPKDLWFVIVAFSLCRLCSHRSLQPPRRRSKSFFAL